LREANNCAFKDLQKALDNLECEAQALKEFLNCGTPGVYDAQKFCITSGASGHEREVITFNVAPLKSDVVSTGVFDKCYSYEVTRVPDRVPCGSALERCTTLTGINYTIDSKDCCGICNVAEPLWVPDTVRIMVPMTKQIKCLVPDFGLTGTFINAALGSIDTLVRLVSCSPCKFCLPARLSFDKEKCMACLDISIAYIMNPSTYCNDIAGYEHRFSCCEEFGSGCKSGCRDCDVAQLKTTLMCIQSEFATDVNNHVTNADRALWMTLGNTAFQLLAKSKRIDVMGVNKCAENVLFSFQVCYFPYRGFCVDACGCKPIKTVIETDPAATFNEHTLGASTSYRIQGEGEFSYEFLKLECGLVPTDSCCTTTTTCCNTTSC